MAKYQSAIVVRLITEKYQSAIVVRLITENLKFIKFFFLQISTPKIAYMLYLSAFYTQHRTVYTSMKS